MKVTLRGRIKQIGECKYFEPDRQVELAALQVSYRAILYDAALTSVLHQEDLEAAKEIAAAALAEGRRI